MKNIIKIITAIKKNFDKSTENHTDKIKSSKYPVKCDCGFYPLTESEFCSRCGRLIDWSEN